MGEDIVQDIAPMSAKALREQDPLKSLRPRHRRFLKHFLKTKNRVQSWKLANPTCKTDDSAYVASSRWLRSNPEVVNWLYDMAGLDDDTLAAVVVDSFSATRSVPVKGGAPIVEKDHYARLKGVELAQKMKGKDGGKGNGNTMNIQIITDPKSGTFKIMDGEEV